MYKRLIFFCSLAQLTIVMPATTSIIDRVTDTTTKSTATTTISVISSDFTTTTATSATSSTISSDRTLPTRQCIYNGQVYNDGETIIANDYCQSICWCMDSQMICTTCPPQTSTSTTSSTISPDTSATPTAGQCAYNGQLYNDGDTFVINDYCQHYCWCRDSHMICTMCPPQTSGQCLYNGQVYNEGDIYNSIDDCNTCSCGWFGTTCTQLFCPNTQASTTPFSFISTSATSATSSTLLPDTTLPTTSTTSSTISPDISPTPRQCIYNGQVYNDGDSFIANNYCQSYCWCMGSQMICTICPTRTSTSTTSSTILSDTSTTPTSTTSSTISPDTSTTPGQCVYNGQVYNDGDNFRANDYCQSYCWCMGSQMLCTMCPTQTSTPTISTTLTPYLSRSTDTKKRRRTTLPAFNTKTKKFHADVFATITKKPHFTNHDSRELGSKRTAIDKGNRNVDI
ncbi:hypothetical protein CHS0354_013887 [Potamilus streckersoni]|uniref:VWFC domain-containing protein n=1 Tax=Potamilus streckersoni TaxID=2493646 RepID=A0AAE0VU02_9BIVA|nr:hypothetical protein CHS0354_013887 [Potamilus streckersoni]